MPNKIRTRFAPSPTGYMHVGNLRTALYAYLIAKKNGGDFILRIEDTDRDRYVEGTVEIIYDTLKETGILWDEGPDTGGKFGPYTQSERMEIYSEYAHSLVKSGGAYYCFCDKDVIEADKREAERRGTVYRYSGKCSDITYGEALLRIKNGESYVIRQKMPKDGITSFTDSVYGTIVIENSEIEDQILIKSDGMPTYNFANVVDDHLMEITHVVRGSEYLTSTPKYNLLYSAFGWTPPEYIHCPPVMKDAQNKLSKRNGDASYQDLIEKGYVSGAVVNYIALLGWSPKGEREKFSLSELGEVFEISGISKSPAIFDPEKLRWLNSEYLREMDLEEFHRNALPHIRQAVKNESSDTILIARCLHQRTEILSDIPPQLDFVDTLCNYSTDLFENKKSKSTKESSIQMLGAAIDALEKLPDWKQETIKETLTDLALRLEVKTGLLMWPVRIAASGKAITPGGAVEVLGILGKDEALRRLRIGLEKLN